MRKRKLEKTNIKFMFWYIRIGRFIYGVLFVLALLITLIQIVERRYSIFAIIFLDVAWALFGVVLESTYLSYRERGTIYIETGKREKRVDLLEYNRNNQSFYVSESVGDYFVKTSGKGYSKGYKKREVTIEEDPGIDRPFLKIIITEKTSRPADNEYFAFALIGDKIEIETPQIIVKNRVKDIKKNQWE